MIFLELLAEHLRKKEGFEDTTYIDKISGKEHIGYGHLLANEQHPEELEILELEDDLDDWTGFSITSEQAEALLQIDINDAINGLSPAFTIEDLEELGVERSIVLISMAFQIGGHGVQKFKGMVEAIHNKDWNLAADEMLWKDAAVKKIRSKWYKQTPDRCQAAADTMRGHAPKLKAIEDEPQEVTQLDRIERLLKDIANQLSPHLGNQQSEAASAQFKPPGTITTGAGKQKRKK